MFLLKKGLLPAELAVRSWLQRGLVAMGPPSPLWLGTERSCCCGGDGGSLFGFLSQGFTMGQALRVVPGYLELSFLSVKKERTEPSHEGVMEYPELEGSHKNQRVQVEGRCCLRAVLLRARVSCSSSHLSSDKRELTR